MWYTSSSGRIELEITEEQARMGHHQGQCDSDVKELSKDPAIASQLAAIDPEALRRELKEYGAWDATELADHEENLQRILWLACGDITEDLHNRSEVCPQCEGRTAECNGYCEGTGKVTKDSADEWHAQND